MCNCNSNESCDECLTVPVGDTGPQGNASFVAIPISLASSNSVTYVEVGRIIAGTDVSTIPFTAAKIGIYTTSPSTGSVRISSVLTDGTKTTLYENTSISSNTATNIENALQYSSAPLNMVPTDVAFILVEVLNQTGTAKSTFVTGVSLYYQP